MADYDQHIPIDLIEIETIDGTDIFYIEDENAVRAGTRLEIPAFVLADLEIECHDIERRGDVGTFGVCNIRGVYYDFENDEFPIVQFVEPKTDLLKHPKYRIVDVKRTIRDLQDELGEKYLNDCIDSSRGAQYEQYLDRQRD